MATRLQLEVWTDWPPPLELKNAQSEAHQLVVRPVEVQYPAKSPAPLPPSDPSGKRSWILVTRGKMAMQAKTGEMFRVTVPDPV